MMSLETYFDIFVLLIIIIKFIFIVLVLSESYFKYIKPEEQRIIEKFTYWKERVKLIFIILMSLLLVYLFNPMENNVVLIKREAKILLFVFGFTLLIIVDWDIIFKESAFLRIVQGSVGNENKPVYKFAF
jgi:hypothetical protein